MNQRSFYDPTTPEEAARILARARYDKSRIPIRAKALELAKHG